MQVQVAERWESRLYPGTLDALRLDTYPHASAVAISAIGRSGLQGPPVVHPLH